MIGRSSGHSSVKAAAYRSGTKQYDQRNGLTADYSHRAPQVAHSEILLPDGAPEALQDRSVFWNELEFAEDKHNRRDQAQLAKDHIIALPRELSLEQQIELARDFAQTFVEQGVGVDLNVHLHSEDNPHAHLMTTTRLIDEKGFGAKARHLNGGFVGGKKVVEAEQLRHQWARFQNQWCQDRGIDLLVTNNDGQWQPELHNGPKTHMSVLDDRLPTRAEVEADRAEAIETDPSSLIDRVARQKAVFTAHDLYRELHKHVTDPHKFMNAKAVLDAHLHKSAKANVSTHDKQYFTVRTNLDTELELKHIATRLLKPTKKHDSIDDLTRSRIVEKNYSFLSDEQKDAIGHITGSQRLSVVIGFAGTGKSTMLKAAADCWKSAGHRVIGAALSGIAAEGLQEGADIKSGTIHSLLIKIDKGIETLRASDVVVIDEAGMLDTQLMHRLLQQVAKAGAKVVLVGDAEQLQPIQAGGPLRSISQQAGYCEISTIRRQNSEVDRQATSDLANGRASKALASYDERGKVKYFAKNDAAMKALITDTVADIEAGKSMAVLAHANKSVNMINDEVRQALIDKGRLTNKAKFTAQDKEGYKIDLDIGVGDRILFRKNDTGLGVKNGSLGTVTVAVNGGMKVMLDNGNEIAVDGNHYNEVSHGYAMTIHKSQGVTVDQSRVLLSPGFDRHLAYVAMSRHKEDLAVYYGQESFGRKSVETIVDQARIQESAIDFAERHGIEVKEEGGDIKLLDQTPDDMISQDDAQDKEATGLLNKGAITEAFRHYESRSRVKADDSLDESMNRLVIDSAADIEADEPATALAHTNHAVGKLTKGIRELRIAAGSITNEIDFSVGEDRTLRLGVGDKVLLDKADKQLGIESHTQATIVATDNGKLTAKMENGKTVKFSSREYQSISHGYAMTVHKSQNYDLDKTRVLVTNTFDRNVSKIAMSQHKKELTLYYGKNNFKEESPIAVMARERSASKSSVSTKVNTRTIKRGGR